MVCCPIIVKSECDILKVFVSYSHESDEHNKQVANLVFRLRQEGIHTMYDGDVRLGQRINDYMDIAIRESDYVLYICTPEYKKKADARTKGVGFETTIITAEIMQYNNENKFIPVLFNGTWKDVPHWAAGKLGIDLSNYFTYEQELSKLISGIKNSALYTVEEAPDTPQKKVKHQHNLCIEKVSNIKEISDLKKCLNFHEHRSQAYQNNSTAFAIAGICHLKLKCYHMANRYFEKALDNITVNSEVFYYAALSLFEGKKPFMHTLDSVEKANCYIEQAISLAEINDNRQCLNKYYCLAKFIYQDYFERKHMRCRKLESLLRNLDNNFFSEREIEEILNYFK